MMTSVIALAVLAGCSYSSDLQTVPLMSCSDNLSKNINRTKPLTSEMR